MSQFSGVDRHVSALDPTRAREIPPFAPQNTARTYTDYIDGQHVLTRTPSAISREDVKMARTIVSAHSGMGTGAFTTGAANLAGFVAGAEHTNISTKEWRRQRHIIRMSGVDPEKYGLDLNPSSMDIIGQGTFVRRDLFERIRAIEDVEFDVEKRYELFRETAPDFAAELETMGYTADVFKEANIKSEDAFDIAVTEIKEHMRALDILDRNAEQVGVALRAADATANFLGGEFVHDPLGTALIPFAAVGSAGRIGAGALRASRGLQATAQRTAAARRGMTAAEQAALHVSSPATRAVSGAGAGLANVGRNMIAAEGRALMKLGYTGAYALEGAAWGAGYSVAAQNQFLNTVDTAWQGTEMEQEFSLAEFAVATGLGMTAAGLLTGSMRGLAAAASEYQAAARIGATRPQLFREFGGGFRPKNQREQVVAAMAAQLSNDPNHLAARQVMNSAVARLASSADEVRVKNHKLISQLTDGKETAADEFDVSLLFDQKALDEAGITDFHVNHVLETLRTQVGDGSLPRARVREVMEDYYHWRKAQFEKEKSGLRDGANSLRFTWAKQQAQIHIHDNIDHYFPGQTFDDVGAEAVERMANARAMDTIESMHLRRAFRETSEAIDPNDPIRLADEDVWSPWYYSVGEEYRVSRTRLARRAGGDEVEPRFREEEVERLLVNRNAEELAENTVIPVERLEDGSLLPMGKFNIAEALARSPSVEEVRFRIVRSAAKVEHEYPRAVRPLHDQLIFRAGDVDTRIMPHFGSLQAAKHAGGDLRTVRAYRATINRPATMIDSGMPHQDRPEMFVHDLLRADNPGLDRNLRPVARWIEDNEPRLKADRFPDMVTAKQRTQARVRRQKWLKESFKRIEDALIESGYDGVLYRNSAEDAGAISVITTRNSRLRIDPDVSPDDPRMPVPRAADEAIARRNHFENVVKQANQKARRKFDQPLELPDPNRITSAEDLTTSIARAFELSDGDAAVVREVIELRAAAWARANGGIDQAEYFKGWATSFFSAGMAANTRINAFFGFTESGNKFIAAARARNNPHKLRTVLHELGHAFSSELDPATRLAMFRWGQKEARRLLKEAPAEELDVKRAIGGMGRSRREVLQTIVDTTEDGMYLASKRMGDGVWIEVEEMFADGFTMWLSRGGTHALEGTFNKFKTWLTQMMRGLMPWRKNIHITSEIEDVFASLFNPAARKAPDQLTPASGFSRATRLTDVDTPPHIRARVRHLQEEYSQLRQFQADRPLTPDEQARLLGLDEALDAVGLRPENIPIRARTRADGITKSDFASEFFLRNWTPTSQAGKDLQRLFRMTEAREQEMRLLRLFRRDHPADHPRVKELASQVEQSRLRIQEQREKLAGVEKVGPNASETVDAMNQIPQNTREGRIAALQEYLKSDDQTAGSLVTDAHIVATTMRILGMRGLVAKFVDQGIGQVPAVRNSFAAVRLVADMIDSTRMKVEAISPQGVVHIESVTGIKRNMIKKMNRITTLMSDAVRRGELKDNRETLHMLTRAMRDGSTPDNPAAAKIVKEARAILKEVGDMGVEAGIWTRAQADTENFFPQRPLIGKLRKERKVLEDELTKEWQAQMLESDDIFYDVLHRMGLASRVVDDEDNVSWVGRGRFEGLEQSKLPTKRAQLSPEEQAQYTRTITEHVDETGQTVAQASAWRATYNMMQENTFRIGTDGKLVRSKARHAASGFERRIDPELILNNETIAQFYDANFFDVMHDYLRDAGFRAAMSRNLQQIPGVGKGVEFDDMIEAARRNVDVASRQLGTSLQEGHRGLTQLEIKYLNARGRLPRVTSESANLLEWAADAIGSGAVGLFGAGIGPIMLFTEVVSSVLNAVHTPKDFADNVRKGMRSIMALPKNERNRALKEFALLDRQFKHMTMSRYSGGEIESGYAFSFWGRRMNPWKQFWATATGRTMPEDLAGGRVGASITQGIRALGMNLMDMHGARAFNIFAQDMITSTATRELSNYMPAALRLARRLDSEGQALHDANRAARESALAAGRTADQARDAGNTAQFKLWQQWTREAGFPNFELATRMREFGLLDSEALTDFIDTAVSAGTGRFGPQRGMTVSEIDWTANADVIAAITDPARRARLEGFQTRAINSIEDVARRALSEPGPFQSITDPGLRSAYGRLMNIMFSYSRSWADNHVMKMGDRPMMRGAGTIALFVFGDTLGRMARRVLRGESWDDIEAEFEEDPYRWVARNALNTPMMGHMQPFLEIATDSLLGNRQTNVGSIGAGPGVRDTAMNLASDALSAPVEAARGDQPRVIGVGDKMGQRMVPLYGFMRGHLMGAHNEREQRLFNRQLPRLNTSDLLGDTLSVPGRPTRSEDEIQRAREQAESQPTLDR